MHKMKLVKNIGLVLFLLGLAIFTSLVFIGDFKMTDEVMRSNLSESELLNLETKLQTEVVGKNYSTSLSFGNDVVRIYNEIFQ